MAKNVSIIRADGSIDTFKPQKVKQSLHNAGATPQEIDQILIEITNRLEEGMSTREIYQEAFRLLKKSDRPAAARYSIKQAIMDLGPSGYPFEQLLGRLMERLGYTVTFPEQVSGKCITHEVDVVAEKAGQKIMIEAKFHNQPGFRTDTKTALYVKARFDEEVKTHYNFMDRQQGFVQTTSAEGEMIQSPLMVMTMGVISPKIHRFADIREITEMAAETRRLDTPSSEA